MREDLHSKTPDCQCAEQGEAAQTPAAALLGRTSSLAFQIICGIVAVLLVFNCVTAVAGYTLFTRSITAEYNDSAFRTAETAATLVDGDKIDWYLSTGGDTDEYRSIWSRMDVLCQKQNVTLIYVIDVDQTDYESFVSVFNTTLDESGYTPWDVGFCRDTTNDEYRDIYRDIYEEGLERASVVRTNDLNGKPPHITSLIPIDDSNGDVAAIMCVQRPMDELASGRQSYLIWVAVAAVALTIFSSVLVSVFLSRRFVAPVRKIADEATRFARENNKSCCKDLVGISKITEIAELGLAIDKMEHDTLVYITDLTTATAERERIEAELSLASSIQANMLPKMPMHIEGVDVYASMNPAREVGGDFFDIFPIGENRLGLVIADVSGKGVPAALFMMATKILVGTHASSCESAAEVLSRVNAALCSNNKEDMFVTMWIGIMDLSTGRMVAANAGHEYPAIRRADGRFELMKDPHGFVLGGLEGVSYKEYEFVLDAGDMFFVYTDGVVEAVNNSNEQFGTDRMLDAMNEVGCDSAEALIARVGKRLAEFADNAPRFDDITMLAIKR